MTRVNTWSIIVSLGLLLSGLLFLVGCTSPRERFFGFDTGPGGTTDPSCPDPGSIVPDITCGSARPEVMCAGSCAQTLDGIVGVGLSSCRCMDGGSGFGAQWICDTSACDGSPDGGMSSDAGTPPDARADSARPPTDAGSCPPMRFESPTEPGCSLAQLDTITRIESQADYDAFVANSANFDCNGCLSSSAFACGTSLGCDDEAGEVFCCLEDMCGPDDACRSAALSPGGACEADANTFTGCVSILTPCSLNPLAPPAECFP